MFPMRQAAAREPGQMLFLPGPLSLQEIIRAFLSEFLANKTLGYLKTIQVSFYFGENWF